MKISEVVQSLFPDGYLDYESFRATSSKPHRERSPRGKGNLPYLCTDLFALTAVLLQRSGAYHHVAPESKAASVARSLGVTKSMRDQWTMLGSQWRAEGERRGQPPPAGLVEIWERFWAHRDESIYASLTPSQTAPAWWHLTLALMCIADEAARGMGFEPPQMSQASFQARLLEVALQRHIIAGEARFSFSTADPDIVCVLPKSRTPMLGCTLRSLSHNLALLPPRGLARAYWLPSEGQNSAADQGRKPSRSQSKPLNCLLVPMPFKISAQDFRAVRSDEERWGWFQLHPSWCPASDRVTDEGFSGFWQFISGLIEAAERDVGQVHVLVFPEAALSHTVFRLLAERLRQSNVELLVAGLFDIKHSERDQSEQGNYAALAVIGENGLISYRQKHHRWRLDRSQIQTYSLGSALDPNFGWWEDLDILSRSLDVYVLRGTTTVTTLICEDLARHDPCQELVRGIGPNLVFALLMDGPQLRARWPARYATVLAEDPGSSVLSFTSLGLIERSNGSGLLPSCRSIGLWRDDRGETIELSIPNWAHALCLSLHPTDFEEHTLDGRSDGGSSESWRLTGVQPVTVNADSNPAKEILKGRWPSS
ncbi:MAG: hypothetical protein E5X51_08265 [Mesorhizobium sp.]|uniref:hypothetical protein n=1 Tax=Mesorhizobium sp. TaxID=1871066 RepID=UPI00121B2C69|nr:hypothetical protein [Mesorhizobium sp.]TIQ21946.1 MAG: hypothetical protein E5X51_08265 [Mesorhizobium sp.]